MKHILIVLFALVVSPFSYADHEHGSDVHGLHFKDGALHLYAKFVSAPQVNEEAFLILNVKNPAEHKNVDIEDAITVSLWMPDMGHGSTPTQIEQVKDADGQNVVGQFRVKEIYFIMGGTWEVRVTLTDAQGKSETQAFEVKLDGGHHGHQPMRSTSVSAARSSDKIIYGCHPLEPSMNNPVEGAIVRIQDGQLVLAYYLTSQTWGAVDEFVVVPTVQEQDGFYMAKSEKATLEIDLRESSQIIVGEHPAVLKFGASESGTEMFCVAGEF